MRLPLPLWPCAFSSIPVWRSTWVNLPSFCTLWRIFFCAFVIFSWVSWGLCVFVCLAVGTVWFPVCEWAHSNVQLCLPKDVRRVFVICSNVCPCVFAVGSEDFTLSRSAISVLSIHARECGFPALWLQHPKRTGSQPTAGSQCGKTICHMGLALLLYFTMTSSPFGCTDLEMSACKTELCKETSTLFCV